MRLIVELFERFYAAPREKRLGRELTRGERAKGAIVLTSPLWLFVIIALVKNLIAGTLHW